MNFLVDSPVTSSSDDFSERNEFVAALANVIASTPKGEPFTIGLFGEWGSGKTSVINFLEEKLSENNKEIKVIRFDPWIYANDTQLLNQFFRVMAEELDEDIDNTGLKGISTAFEAYADASELLGIIPVVGGYLKRLGGAADFVADKTKEKADDRNLAKIKEQICEGLKESDKQFLVIIDDIDRLTNKQIRMIFQLVNSIAKFPNIIYLLSFDRKIVVRALKDVQQGDGNDYLEKIIQVSLELPVISQSNINNYLKSLLENMIAHDTLFDPGRWELVYFKCIENKLANYRDVKRFVNTFSFMLSSLHNEIDFADLACMAVLQIWEPDLFSWIYQKRSLLCESDSGSPHIDRQGIAGEMRQTGFTVTSYMLEVTDFLFNEVGDGIITGVEKDKRKISGRVAHIDNLERMYHFVLNTSGAYKALLKDYVYKADLAALRSYLCDTASKDQINDFLSQVNGGKVDELRERYPVILQALLFAVGKHDGSDIFRPFALSGNNRIWFTISYISKNLGQEKTEEIIETSLEDFDLDTVMSFAYFIKEQQLAYGQFQGSTANPTGQLVSLPFLKQLENFFLARLQKDSKSVNLLERQDFLLPLLLWKYLDERSCDDYIDESLESSDKAKVMYAIRNVGTWHDVGTSMRKNGFTFPDEEDERVSSESVLDAIGRYRMQENFWDMPDYLRVVIATFALRKQGVNISGESVSVEQAQEELHKWREDYENSSKDVSPQTDR